MKNTEESVLKNIVQIRKNKNITQRGMGDELGISESAYNRIESGKIALSYYHLSNIARAFNMDVVDVITYPEIYAPITSEGTTKVLVELDVSNDEFIKMGLKDKIVRVLNK